jgi:hypothetical protein
MMRTGCTLKATAQVVAAVAAVSAAILIDVETTGWHWKAFTPLLVLAGLWLVMDVVIEKVSASIREVTQRKHAELDDNRRIDACGDVRR